MNTLTKTEQAQILRVQESINKLTQGAIPGSELYMDLMLIQIWNYRRAAGLDPYTPSLYTEETINQAPKEEQ